MTSSTMPIVKWFFGSGRARFSKTARTIPGSNSFEDSPYLPPTTVGIGRLARASANVVSTSMYSGSPGAPGSLVRSSTDTARAVFGSAARNSAAGNGRYSRIFRTPTRSPLDRSQSTVSCATSAPDPMATTTRSACG